MIKGSLNQRSKQNPKHTYIYQKCSKIHWTKTDRSARRIDKFTVLIGESISPFHFREAVDPPNNPWGYKRLEQHYQQIWPNIYITVYPTAEHLFLSRAHGPFAKINGILSNERSLVFQNIKPCQSCSLVTMELH